MFELSQYSDLSSWHIEEPQKGIYFFNFLQNYSI